MEEPTIPPPPPIVYFMLDRECYPNDRWLIMTGVILCGEERIEMDPVLITDSEVTEQMEAMDMIAQEAYRHTVERVTRTTCS